MHRYVLVDCAVRRDAANTLRFYAEDLPHRSLFLGRPEQAHADAGPWLVQVDTTTTLHGWLNALDGTCVPCVSYLASPLAFEPVFAHLQSMLAMALPDGSSALLRFYDPRVMQRLRHVLSAAQLDGLTSPFTEWHTCLGRLTNAH
ncbi:DUF4123 domain-containing protein [Xanthomonas populi]|uniref:DUF4123 domain-containing protein n=1 Tax=Xanthomonas populi TaxID=53414 RepID=A0A2S7EPN1_9XANT|nr:DUF4123 domain-containing protein [Xanthomonas populi]PPU94746.1 hypothetical protein XpopCFBP1817_09705 [Xanthomonas populi]